MQIALTITAVLIAAFYVVRRLFFKKKESCENCEGNAR